MSQLKLSLPVSPFHINQAFGANPEYYARFLDSFGNAYKGHMGTDLMAPHGTPVLAPCDGMAWYVGPDPHGGDGIYLQPNGTYDYEGGQAYFRIIHWHLCSKDDPQFKPVIPTTGQSVPVKAGDILGYADNTGAPFESSGDHLHWGLLPVDADGKPIHPDNGFGGCVDIMPYCNLKFAGAIQPTAVALQSASTIVNHIASSNIPASQKSPLLAEILKVVTYLENLI